MVKQDSGATVSGGGKSVQDLFEVVGPIKEFNDHSLDAQIIAPDLFDQFSVMLPLDKNAARHGDSGALRWRGNRTRCGDLARGRERWHDERDWAAIDHEAIGHRKRAALAATVFELHETFTGTDHRTTPFRLAVLHDEPPGERNFLPSNRTPARPHRGKGIVIVSLVKHVCLSILCGWGRDSIGSVQV